MEIIFFITAIKILYMYLQWFLEPKIDNIYDYDRKVYGDLDEEETARYERIFGRKIYNGKSKLQ